MSVKAMVENIIWLTIDGLAAAWMVKTLFQIILEGAQPFELMAQALCG